MSEPARPRLDCENMCLFGRRRNIWYNVAVGVFSGWSTCRANPALILGRNRSLMTYLPLKQEVLSFPLHYWPKAHEVLC